MSDDDLFVAFCLWLYDGDLKAAARDIDDARAEFSNLERILADHGFAIVRRMATGLPSIS